MVEGFETLLSVSKRTKNPFRCEVIGKSLSAISENLTSDNELLMMISLKEIMLQTKSPSQRVAIAEVMVTIAPNMNSTACLDICQLLFAAITRTKRTDPRVAIGEKLGELAQCLEDVDKASLAQTLRQEYLDGDSSKI